jgi:hypothetical protein
VRVAGDVVPADGCRAGIEGDQGRQRPDRGALARAVGAEEPVDRARLDPQIESVERRDLAIPLVQPVCDE